MSGPCPYVCFNKTEYGYCRGTVCTNKSVIEFLNHKRCNILVTSGPNTEAVSYRVPCLHCGGLGYLGVDITSRSPCLCPICMGEGVVLHFEDNVLEKNAEESDSCKGCKHIALRYPYASMYPCNNCIRADMKDYYEPQEENNG